MLSPGRLELIVTQLSGPSPSDVLAGCDCRVSASTPPPVPPLSALPAGSQPRGLCVSQPVLEPALPLQHPRPSPQTSWVLGVGPGEASEESPCSGDCTGPVALWHRLVQNMFTLQSTSGPSYRIKTQVALVQDAGLSRPMPHIAGLARLLAPLQAGSL